MTDHQRGKTSCRAKTPFYIAISLILFISWVFVSDYLPYRFKTRTLHKCLVELCILYFIVMTLVFIVATARSDPGYLDKKY